MIEFFYHDGLHKDIAAFEKRFHSMRDALAIFERLCNAQFDPANPLRVIAPSKLHRITQNDVWSLWKMELVVPDTSLRSNQYPRMWFVVKGSSIALLCMATHIDKYDDEKMNRLALSRISDFF
jgi:hypothetical protein